MRYININNRSIIIDLPIIIDRDEEICKLCKDHFFPDTVNGTIHFMCEGNWCKEAEELYDEYLADCAAEEAENKKENF